MVGHKWLQNGSYHLCHLPYCMEHMRKHCGRHSILSWHKILLQRPKKNTSPPLEVIVYLRIISLDNWFYNNKNLYNTLHPNIIFQWLFQGLECIDSLLHIYLTGYTTHRYVHLFMDIGIEILLWASRKCNCNDNVCQKWNLS